MLLLLFSLAIPCSAEYVDVGGGIWLDMETGEYLTDEEYNKRIAVSEPEEPTKSSVPEMVVDGSGDSVAAVSSPVADSDGMADGEEQQPEEDNSPALLSSYQPADYTLGTSNVAIFSGLVSKVPWGQHYVYWRDGQYTYRFAYGKLTFANGRFTGDGNEITVISYDTESGYNSSYTYTSSVDSSFVLTPGNRLVYSDLGDYPGLADKEVQKYATMAAFVLCAAAFWCLGSSIRRACFGG